MKSRGPRLVVFSATLLGAVLAMPRWAPAAQRADAARWSNLQAIPSGATILVTARDGRVLPRTMVLVNDTELVTLDLDRLPPDADISTALFVVREAPAAVAGGLTWHAKHLALQAGVVREDGKVRFDLRPALDTFDSRDVALVVRPVRPGSKLVTMAAAGVGLLFGVGIAAGMGMEIQCQPSCGVVEAGMIGVGVGLPVGAGFAGYYATRRGERIVYKAPVPAAQPPIDDLTWERVRRALPPSFRGTGNE